MLTRRRVLMRSVALVSLLPASEALAFVPVILAALAAITAIVVATGKAADAIDAAVKSGYRLWTVVSGLPEEERARKDIEAQKAGLRNEIGVRRDVVAGATAAQSANAAFVSSVRYYLITRDSDAWGKVVPAMQKAAVSLGSMAGIFRDKASWFPASAQDALADLPNLYKLRVGVLLKLEDLSKDKPPTTDDEVSAWSKLVDGYDELRVQSLRLIRALDAYTGRS